jgi:hypothetical protein
VRVVCAAALLGLSFDFVRFSCFFLCCNCRRVSENLMRLCSASMVVVEEEEEGVELEKD